MWQAAAAQAGGALLSSGLDFLGGELGRDAQEKEAKKQRSWAGRQAEESRDWQREMYRRRYRMTMFDLRKAGLNPILAAVSGVTGGGFPSAGIPSGTAANLQDYGQAFSRAGGRATKTVTSALEARQIAKTTKLTEATTAKTSAETGVLHQELDKRQKEAIASSYAPANAASIQSQNFTREEILKANLREARAMAERAERGLPRRRAEDKYYQSAPGQWSWMLGEALRNIGLRTGSAENAATAANIIRRW